MAFMAKLIIEALLTVELSEKILKKEVAYYKEIISPISEYDKLYKSQLLETAIEYINIVNPIFYQALPLSPAYKCPCPIWLLRNHAAHRSSPGLCPAQNTDASHQKQHRKSRAERSKAIA